MTPVADPIYGISNLIVYLTCRKATPTYKTSRASGASREKRIKETKMINRRLHTGIFMLLIAVLVLASALPALADSPEVMLGSGDYVLAECGDFDVRDAYSERFWITEKYDEQGNLEQLTFHGFAHDRVYNSVTGYEVKSRYTFHDTLDVAADQWHSRGIVYKINVPGYGSVYADLGMRIYTDLDGWNYDELVRSAGRMQRDEAALCEAMDQ
jgi:hypothetical protein